MRCEDVREVLPAYAHRELDDARHVEVHLASCEGCSRELDRYRELAVAVGGLAQRLEDPSPELKSRLVALAPRARRGGQLRRLAEDHPNARVAAVSLGGAALGATAIALLWWRAARRTLERGETAGPPSSLTARRP